jgi:hypothetical protein
MTDNAPSRHTWEYVMLQGHKVTLFNRGKTANRPVPGESEEAFQDRIAKASFVKGDRTNVEVRGLFFFFGFSFFFFYIIIHYAWPMYVRVYM